MQIFCFLAQVVVTSGLTGLIWFVQVVHYPLFLVVPDPQDTRYSSQHQTRTRWVVAPLMLIELLTAILLVWPVFRPAFVSLGGAVLGLAMLALIWISTAFVQVPLHRKLTNELGRETIRQLVATNWVRRVAWSVRAALVTWWLSRALQSR